MSTEPTLAEIQRSLVKVHAVAPDDALTAGVLGVDRVGSGVVIDDRGLVLTIGYLITEATDAWITVGGRAAHPIAAHPLAYDQATGLGLVMPLAPLAAPALAPASAAEVAVGDSVDVVSYSGFAPPQAARLVARREFAGAWEYLLDDALFTAPAHPHWSGAALLDANRRLVGLGSLLVRETVRGVETNANLFLPMDLLAPILDDLVRTGRAPRPPRPWLGLYAAEADGRVLVSALSERGPARRAGVREGDQLAAVAGVPVTNLPDFYRRVWSLGPAGVAVPLTLLRRGSRHDVTVRSVDRNDVLTRPRAH